MKLVCIFSAAAFSFLTTASRGHAASTLYWSGGDGTWDTTALSWTLNADRTAPFQAWVNANADTAFFSGTAGTVTLSAPITAGGLTFSTDGYTIAGGTLSLTGDTSTIDTGSGTQTISSALSVGSSVLAKAGSGTLVLTGAGVAATTSEIDLSGGTLAVRGSGASFGVLGAAIRVYVGSGGSGALVVDNGGTLKNTYGDIGNSDVYDGTDYHGQVTVDGSGSSWTLTGGLNVGSSGTGSLTISNGGVVTDAASNIGYFNNFHGDPGGGNGTVLVTGAGSTWTTRGLRMGVDSETQGSLTIENGGTVVSTGGGLGMAQVAGSAASLTVTGAGSTLTATGGLQVGNGGAATALISNGGKVISGGGWVGFTSGGDPASATVTGAGSAWLMSSSSFSMSATGTLKITDGGTMTSSGSSIAGGAGDDDKITVESNGASWADGTSIVLGYDGTGTLNINAGGSVSTGTYFRLGQENAGHGIVNITGGSLTIGTNFDIGVSSTGTAAYGTITQTGGTVLVKGYMDFGAGNGNLYSLQGGTLEIDGSGITTSTGTYTISLEGGTLRAGANWSTTAKMSLKKGTQSTVDTPAGVAMTLGGILSESGASGSGSLLKTGDGAVVLSATNTYTGATTISAGAIRKGSANAIANTNIVFDGGVLEFGTTDVAVNAGTGGGQVQWIGDGGFSASGGARTVNFNSGVALTWGDSNFVPDGHKLLLSSTASNNTITFPNAVDFGGAARTVQVANGSAAIDATLSGILSNGSLVKAGPGTLLLSGANTYSGATEIQGGALRTTAAANLPANTNVVLDGGVIELTGTGASALAYGTGPGQLQWSGSGGFSISGATGNTRTISYESGAALAWDDANFVPDGGSLILSSPSSDGTTVFPNAIDFAGAARTVQVDNGSASTDATLSGALSNGGLVKTGAGTLTFGSAGLLGSGVSLGVNGGTLALGTLAQTAGAVTLMSGSITGTATLTGDSFEVQSGTLSAPITGAGAALTKTTAGTTTLSGSNSYTGGVALEAGTLALGNSGALGTTGPIAFHGGTLQFSASNTTDYSPRFSTEDNQSFRFDTNGRSVTLAGNVTSTGGTLTKLGTGTLTLSGTNTYTGGTTVSAGTLSLGGSGALGDAGGILLNGGTLQFSAGNTVDYSSRLGVASGQSYLIDTGGQSVTFASPLAGAGNALVKSGTGTLTLSGTNTYTGGTTVSAGTLKAGGNASAFGTGAISLAGGSLEFANDSNLTFGAATTVSSNATITLSRLTPGSSIGFTMGTLSIGAQTLSVARGTNLSGTGSLSIGAVTVTGNTTFSADTGTILSLASITRSSGTRNMTFTGSGNTAVTGVVGPSAITVTKTGTGTLTLYSANTYTSGTTVSDGTLQLSGPATLGTAASAVTVSGGTLDLGGSTLGNTTVTVSGGTIQNGTIGSTYTLQSGTLSALITGTTLTKTSSGTLAITGTANTYTGKTAISAGTLSVAKLANVSAASSLGQPATTMNGTIDIGATTVAGTLQYLGDASSPSASSSTNRIVNLAGTTGGATLDASNPGSGTITFTSAFTATGGGSKTLTLTGTNTGANTIQGAIVNNTGTNKTSVSKTGAGTWVLSGTNTYTGATTISAGLLKVNGSLNSGSAVTVSGSGTLGGGGNAAGTVALNSGGKISPGNAEDVSLYPGTLNTGAETWAGSAGYVWELNDASDAPAAKGVSYDWLNIAGALNITATNASAATKFTIYITSLAGNAPGTTPGFVRGRTYSFPIATATGITNFSPDKFLIDTSAFFNDPGNIGGFSIAQVDNNLVLNYTAIPEPGVGSAAIGVALLAMIFAKRRRLR